MPEPADLAVVDLVVLGVCAVSVLFGVLRGFVREALSLLVWVFAFAAARIASPAAVGLFAPWVTEPGLREPIAFGAVFLAALVAGSLLTRLLGLIVDATGLTGLDRTLGLLFGAARALVLLVVVTALAAPLFADAAWWQASRLLPWLLAAQEQTFDLLAAFARLLGLWSADEATI